MNNRGGSMSMIMKRGNRQKPKNLKYVLKRLWDYLYKFKWRLLLALILTISSNLLSLIGPKLLGKAIDAMRISDGADGFYVDLELVFYYATLMIIFYVASSIFAYVLRLLMINISKKIVYKMREDAFDKMLMLPVSYFDTNLIGDIISKISYDIDTINASLSNDVINICTSIITVVGALIMMVTIEWRLILVFAVTIPISLLFTRYMLRKTKSLFKDRSYKLGMLNGYVEEAITGTKTIKAYSNEEKIIEMFDEYNVDSVEASYKAEYHGAITGPGVNFINNLSLALVCLFGSILLIQGKLSAGEFASFANYSRRFSGPINEIANIFIDIQSALAAGERVFELIDATAEQEDNVNAIDLECKGNVIFDDVCFSYELGKPIIKHLSFKTYPGQVIAIVGPTGGGKTTIVNLLMRFYDIESGKIQLDGVDIYDIKRKSLRENYAMVLQDTWLFEASVMENLMYGASNVSREDVIKACKEAKIHNFIMSLPERYDTILSEGGTNISKGQKQLLTIARAMLLDRHMLILDEATSNVDTRTEKQITSAMQKLMQGKTCFIIAHRLSTIVNADLILVIKNGSIVEQGKHQELLDKQSFYSEMYNSQFD